MFVVLCPRVLFKKLVLIDNAFDNTFARLPLLTYDTHTHQKEHPCLLIRQLHLFTRVTMLPIYEKRLTILYQTLYRTDSRFTASLTTHYHNDGN